MATTSASFRGTPLVREEVDTPHIKVTKDDLVNPNGAIPRKEGIYSLNPESLANLKYPRWAPVWEDTQRFAFQQIPPFRHTDRGFFGDPSFDSLFKGTGAQSKPITPKFGSEVSGIQLSTLTDRQKDDLALLVAQRGVVVFRGQDFKHRSFNELKDWGRYFGPLHITSGSPAPLGEPYFHLVYDEAPSDGSNHLFDRHTNFITWHSDVSFENQPTGLTALAAVETGGGGDTQFVDNIEAYERLSPTLQKYLDGLYVVHSSRELVEGSLLSRREPTSAIHPLVRYHPVLRKKYLFINGSTNDGSLGGFSRRILGLKDEESDLLLNFLLRHLNSLLDAHIRASWDENTVVVWDNRRINHTATVDLEPGSTRLGFRVTTIAERPVANEKEYEDWTPEKETEFIKNTPEYLSLTPEEYHNISIH